MADHSSPSHPPDVPPAMLAERREGWHVFTRMMLWNSVAPAAVLLALLVVFKIL